MAATWQESSPKKDSQPSRPRYYPKVKPSGSWATVDQARLSLMGTDATPCLAAHEALSKWMRKFYEPEWTRETLEFRKVKLGFDIQTLRQLVEYPPDDWTPARWLEMHTRLESWRGQYEALWAHCHARRWDLPEAEARCLLPSEIGNESAASSPGRVSTSSGATSGIESDPFATV